MRSWKTHSIFQLCASGFWGGREIWNTAFPKKSHKKQPLLHQSAIQTKPLVLVGSHLSCQPFIPKQTFCGFPWVWKTPRCWRARTTYHSTTTASNRHFWEDGSLRILQRQMMMIYSSPTQKHATDTRYVYTHICTYLIHICIYIYSYIILRKTHPQKLVSRIFNLHTNPRPGKLKWITKIDPLEKGFLQFLQSSSTQIWNSARPTPGALVQSFFSGEV